MLLNAGKDQEIKDEVVCLNKSVDHHGARAMHRGHA